MSTTRNPLGLNSGLVEKLSQLVINGDLAKSFNQVANLGMRQDGRVGLNAMFKDRSDNHFNISMEEKDFYFVKDMTDVKADGMSYSYTMKTQNGDMWADHALFENGLGKESMPNYGQVAIPIKIYGIKTSVSHLARLINQGDSFGVDIEDEELTSAIISITRSQEHDASFGLDYFINEAGNIENLVFNTNQIGTTRRMNLRHATGIQAHIRAHNFSARTIAPEKAGYGNIQSIVQDLKGKVISQEDLDRIIEPSISQGGEIDEALCSIPQARAFRAQFFAMQRGDINTSFAINGPKVDGSPERKGFPVETLDGIVWFRPQRYRRLQMRRPTFSSNAIGQMPDTPAVPTLTSVPDQNTSFKAGQKVKISIQAVNIAGLSSHRHIEHTIAADGEGIKIEIPFSAYAEKFHVYATPPSANPSEADLHFVGQALADMLGVTTFLHKEAIMSGLESLLMSPRKDFKIGGKANWFRAVVGGKSMYELDLAFMGAHYERSIMSYFQYICVWGRTYILLDNVGAETLRSYSANDLLVQG